MTGDRPTVSVIIPVLDEEASLPGAIRSARAAGADEAIVVDGGSADGTVPVARALADVVLSRPPGRGAQMNAGAHASAGRILLFLHADTRLPDGSVEAVRDAVARRSYVGGAFPVRLAPSRGASAYGRFLLLLTGRMINLRSRLFDAYTGDQGIFVRRDVFEGIGGFPEVPLMEDVLFSRRLAGCGRTVLLPFRIDTSARRWEASGPLRTILLMWGIRLAHLLGMSPARCAEIYAWSRGR